MSDPALKVGEAIQDVLLDLRALRKRALARAVELGNEGNTRQADYHTGLADGYLAAIRAMTALAMRYPARRYAKAVEEVLEEASPRLEEAR